LTNPVKGYLTGKPRGVAKPASPSIGSAAGAGRSRTSSSVRWHARLTALDPGAAGGGGPCQQRGRRHAGTAASSVGRCSSQLVVTLSVESEGGCKSSAKRGRAGGMSAAIAAAAWMCAVCGEEPRICGWFRRACGCDVAVLAAALSAATWCARPGVCASRRPGRAARQSHGHCWQKTKHRPAGRRGAVARAPARQNAALPVLRASRLRFCEPGPGSRALRRASTRGAVPACRAPTRWSTPALPATRASRPRPSRWRATPAAASTATVCATTQTVRAACSPARAGRHAPLLGRAPALARSRAARALLSTRRWRRA
jgi:hypothetical protein